MAQSECIRVHLKPGMTDTFTQWAKQVANRLDEARASMTEQGVIEQNIFLERGAGGDFIVLYCKVEDLGKARAVFQRSTRKIDLEMTEMVEATWDKSQVVRLEPILEL